MTGVVASVVGRRRPRTTMTTAGGGGSSSSAASPGGRHESSSPSHSGGDGGRIDSLRKGRRVTVLSDLRDCAGDGGGSGGGSTLTNDEERTRRRCRRRQLRREVTVMRKIGEGGSSFVYLVKTAADEAEGDGPVAMEARASGPSADAGESTPDKADGEVLSTPPRRSWPRRALSLPGTRRRNDRPCDSTYRQVVLKATNIRSPGGNGHDAASDDDDYRDRRLRTAETEVAMLRRLSSHPNVLGLIDAGWWVGEGEGDGNGNGNAAEDDGDCKGNDDSPRKRASRRMRHLGVHCVLLEYCPGGSLMDLVARQRRIMLACKCNGNGNGNINNKGGGVIGNSSRGPRRNSLQMLSCRRSKSVPVAVASALPPSYNGGGAGGDSDGRKEDAALETGYLPLPVVADILRQISDALSFLHNCFDDGPVIHRDVKPENVLLVPRPSSSSSPTSSSEDNDGNVSSEAMYYDVRLADFGSATTGRTSLRTPEERSRARDEVLRGTTQMYRAPEMVDLHMAQELTERTDVWALGCTLYLTLYLRNCFEENSNLAILSGRYAVPSGSGNPYGDASPAVEDVLARMIDTDPDSRAGIAEIRDCAEALSEGRDLPPRRSGRPVAGGGGDSVDGDVSGDTSCGVWDYNYDGRGKGSGEADVDVDARGMPEAAVEVSSNSKAEEHHRGGAVAVPVEERSPRSAADAFLLSEEASKKEQLTEKAEQSARQASGEESGEIATPLSQTPPRPPPTSKRTTSMGTTVADRRRMRKAEQAKAMMMTRKEQSEAMARTLWSSVPPERRGSKDDGFGREEKEGSPPRKTELRRAKSATTGPSSSSLFSSSSFRVEDIYRDLMASYNQDWGVGDKSKAAEDADEGANTVEAAGADAGWFTSSFFSPPSSPTPPANDPSSRTLSDDPRAARGQKEDGAGVHEPRAGEEEVAGATATAATAAAAAAAAKTMMTTTTKPSEGIETAQHAWSSPWPCGVEGSNDASPLRRRVMSDKAIIGNYDDDEDEDDDSLEGDKIFEDVEEEEEGWATTMRAAAEQEEDEKNNGMVMTEDILRKIQIFPPPPQRYGIDGLAGAAAGKGAADEEGDASCPGGIELSLAGTSTTASSASSSPSFARGPWDEYDYGGGVVNDDDDHDEGDFTSLLDGDESGVGRSRNCYDAGAVDYLRRVCPSIFSVGEI